MGTGHINCIKSLSIARLVAVCDVREASARAAGSKFRVPWYTDHRAMLEKEALDGVHVCTPHPAHPRPAIDAMRRGLHVLTEKPMAATIGDAERMAAAARRHRAILAVMYQQRARAIMQKVHALIASGKIGELVRIGLTAAKFRTQAYYDGDAWRGTWRNEGGGVTINQAPHELDLFQWFAGLPVEVYARTDTLLHRMETEDIVSAVVRFANGAHGTIHLSVCEAPGSQRWEIAGTKGKITMNGDARLATLKLGLHEFLSTSKEQWGGPEATWQDVTVKKQDEGHGAVVENFCRAILGEAEPFVTGEEGLKSQELVNALIMSGQLHRPLRLPIDRKKYAQMIKELSKKGKRPRAKR